MLSTVNMDLQVFAVVSDITLTPLCFVYTNIDTLDNDPQSKRFCFKNCFISSMHMQRQLWGKLLKQHITL